MKKTILIISNTSGGLYLFRQELISRLIDYFDVKVLTSDTGKIEELKRLGCSVSVVDIDRRGVNPLTDIKYTSCVFRKIQETKPSVIITYTVKPNIYGGICARLCRINYAENITGLGTGFQSKTIRTFLVQLYRTALKKANVIFCENTSIKNELIKYKIGNEDNIVVLHGAGVNLKRFSYIEYPNDDMIFRFLFIGRVMKEKGINELIVVINRLNQDGINCKLVVVGGCEENYEKPLRDNRYIEYKGKQLDVRPYIAETHCFVLPSYHEGMANTNLECAASGRPIITSDIPGCKEAVVDNVSGYLCRSKDVESLYTKMKLMIQLRNEDRKLMGLYGRKHMEFFFDKEKVVEQTMNYLIQ